MTRRNGRVRTRAALTLIALVIAGCGTSGGLREDDHGEGAGATAPTASNRTRSEGAGTTGRGYPTTLPRLVEDARWVRRDGTEALQVTPSTYLRNATDPAVYDEAWRRVVAAVPRADAPNLRDQFVCHATFASKKESWFLEPARPAVGYWKTVEAGCNPGDVTDVG